MASDASVAGPCVGGGVAACVVAPVADSDGTPVLGAPLAAVSLGRCVQLGVVVLERNCARRSR